MLLSQGHISLLQRTPIAAPCADKIMFHVKHAPIEKLTAAFGSTLNQNVHLWIDNLYRKCFHQISRVSTGFSIDMNRGAPATELNTQAITLFAVPDFPEHRKIVTISLNQGRNLTRSE